MVLLCVDVEGLVLACLERIRIGGLVVTMVIQGGRVDLIIRVVVLVDFYLICLVVIGNRVGVGCIGRQLTRRGGSPGR
jgi:hypothetical protein